MQNRPIVSISLRLALATLLAVAFYSPARAQNAAPAPAVEDPPTEWIDPDTGHRVVRLSREPESQSLYFHQYPFSADGKKMIFSSPTGISTVDLQTRETQKIVEGPARPIVTGRKTGDVYFTKERVVYSTPINGGQPRKIVALDRGMSATTVNADETLLAGSITHGSEPFDSRRPTTGTSRGQRIQQRFDQHLAMELIFVDTKTGEIRKVNKSNDWQNHIQFSPTDPNLLMFCHEGPWHKVDRIWTIRTDGSELTKIHARTKTMEIAGHEWFGNDGKTIWYDLQTPRGESFWVAGYDVATGARTHYHLMRDEWGVHFNSSPDGTLFASDGGSEGMVAKSQNGKWINLLRPKFVPDRGPPETDSTKLIQSGVFESERLVNMSKHDYELEPNVIFTPDMKWIVFRSNMFGPSHVFAVEVAKAAK